MLADKCEEVEASSQWIKSHFEHIKYLAPTHKGDLGEAFIESACEKLGFKDVSHK